jgi:choline dehydrogenase-like flavoprotein
MGDSSATSVLDPDNQCWHVKGLYVTDGAAFPSQGTQNPTLTILALTARACAHAVRALGAYLMVLWSELGSLPNLMLVGG